MKTKTLKSLIAMLFMTAAVFTSQVLLAQEAAPTKASKSSTKSATSTTSTTNTSSTSSGSTTINANNKGHQQTESSDVPDYNKMDKQSVKKDADTRMAKFDEEYNKIKAHSEKTNDPAMKADMERMLAQMDLVKADMAHMDGASAGQEAQLKQKLHEDMDQCHKMRDEMKAKYGGQKSGGGKGEVKSGGKQKQHAATGTAPQQ